MRLDPSDRKIKVRRHGKSCSLPCGRADDGSTKSRPTGRHLPVFQNHGPRHVSEATPKERLLFRPGRRGTLQNRSLAHREGAIGPAERPNSKQAEKAEQSGHASKPLVGRFSNVAFTFAGLTKLDVDPDTLATFPQAFRDGMAARATILGDKGDAAPEKWDGYLGSLQIDGVMWLNFRLSSRCADDILAEYEKRLDQAKAVFPSAWFPPCPAPKMRRGGAEEEGSKPADDDGAPKQIDGAEVLHVEFGMANYAQEGEGKPFRVEHFGYRDGVSQPYANLDLNPPPPGGGTPKDNGSWAPVAPGEILLGQLDEDGRVQQLPANEALRTNGSYMALRKLEQDVVGFRSFLKRHQQESQPPLGPQMVGRWPDGSPLVKFPEGPEHGPGRGINDFRYQRDDPFGRRCPIGAHIRRANPRDTNHRDQARRHRLFRRGISYGGPLLPADFIDEECPRGLLFVSMQARLDRQFEFVLTSWLGRGELEGQAGAKLDPLLGDHSGRLEDAFQPTDSFGPVTGLPRFVTMRGGEYFFIPSVSALAGLSNGDAFPIDDLPTTRCHKTPSDPFRPPRATIRSNLSRSERVCWRKARPAARRCLRSSRHRFLPAPTSLSIRLSSAGTTT